MSRLRKMLGVAVVLVLLSAASLVVRLSHDAACGSAPPLPAHSRFMQANVYRCYGSPDVVKLEQVPVSLPAADRVLVKVRAASVNPLDWHYLRGKPYLMRLESGYGVPDDVRLGVDFAGTVEAVGENVKRFKPGDEVFGGADGSFAQYVSVRENGSLAAKPADVSFEQAAAVPIAAVTALQALRDKGGLKPGQRVLINGASGGVGTFAVQIAKTYGAEVTAVCGTKSDAMVRALGADHVIDYTREDFTRGVQRYDLILDLVATHTLWEYRRVLTPQGTLVLVGGQDDGPWMTATLWRMAQALLISEFSRQQFRLFLADLDRADLTTLGDLLQSGKVKSVIDRTYPLDQVPAALRYVEQGHAHGKVVITVPQ